MNNICKRFPVLSKIATPNKNVYITSRFVSNKPEDVTIHTGQQWDADDYRMARFVNAPKQVNPNWAVELIAKVPAIETTARTVWCDGGSGPEGHPRVYINLDKPGNNACGYCGLRFIKKGSHH